MTDESISADINVQPKAPSVNEGIVNDNLGQVQAQTQEVPSGYIPKERVNKLVVDAKAKAYEKGMAEAQARLQSQQEAPVQSSQAQVDESAINSLLDKRIEALQQQNQQMLMQRQAQEEAQKICSKLNTSAEEFKKNAPDYEDALSRVGNFQEALPILQVAHQLENPAEVLYHLANNPRDIPTLNALSLSMPEAAKLEMQRISDRIKQNANAKNSAPAPIGQIETSNRDGIGSSEPQTIADFKAIYRG